MGKRVLNSIVFLVVLATCSCTYTGNQQSKGKMVFEDEFSYTGLPDSTKWTFFTNLNDWGWGYDELQRYTYRSLLNARVGDGVLRLTAKREKFYEKNFTSARITTKPRQGWKYGTIEIKARAKLAKGTSCEIWMLPVHWKYGPWPESGVIHIMKKNGGQPGTIHGIIQTKKFNQKKGNQREGAYELNEGSGEYHTYKVKWTEKSIDFHVDGEEFFSYDKRSDNHQDWPFDQEFYLLLNITVGNDIITKEEIDMDTFPSILEVDYVRVYED